MKNITKRSLTGKDVSRLANTCAKFEDAEFDRPILSMYESRKTTISRAFRQRQVMVSIRMNNYLSFYQAEEFSRQRLSVKRSVPLTAETKYSLRQTRIIWQFVISALMAKLSERSADSYVQP